MASCNVQQSSYQRSSKTIQLFRREGIKCNLCSKSFLQRASLKLHVDGVHSREPRHACGVCGEMFKTRIAKRNHERVKHEGIPPARNKVCDHCGKAFTNKSTLLDHINTHTGARPFACKLCDATFGYKSALYLHGRYKHKIKKKNKKIEENTCTEQENGT
ncbi:zinc finger and BTB domain-containing protein 41-like [Choristoneura fumiferana]|uniref:zinc finger and BTB domain-containing protein 41-like n=1 Tax=Choristoneura fumiferana TaxID=7141 RepID=UPI003D15C318